jgi:hypothetical protein
MGSRAFRSSRLSRLGLQGPDERRLSAVIAAFESSSVAAGLDDIAMVGDAIERRSAQACRAKRRIWSCSAKDRTVSSRPTIRVSRGGSFLTRSVAVIPVIEAIGAVAERVIEATKQ